VSAKLTPEICINKATSNSRLTAVGRRATAADRHSQTCLRTLFFLSPYLWWDNNWTTPACWKTYWNCIAFELGTLCGVCLFFLVRFCFILDFLVFFPFDETTTELLTISRNGGWGTNAKIIKTETLFHLNLEIFILFIYSFYLFYYLYIFHLFILYIYIYFFFFF
jgi:hypothetical protein